MSVHPFPHHYRVSARCLPAETVDLSAAQLPDLASLPPVEFGGPGDHWSPETLLVGALASCYSLTFRAIASRRNIPFKSLDCDIEGTLDREGGNSRFTALRIDARLELSSGADVEAAEKALQHAKQGCLISNSLNAEVTLDTHISFAD